MSHRLSRRAAKRSHTLQVERSRTARREDTVVAAFTGVGFEPIPTAIVAVLAAVIIVVTIIRSRRR